MRLPDGTILMHVRRPYDPLKAHEYYLRTRQLKGRKPKQGKLPQRTEGRSEGVQTYRVNLPSGETINLTRDQLMLQRAYVEERVKGIKEGLKELSTKLREAMANAKKMKAKAEREAAKPDTAAEKSKAAKESKQYREKHKTELATKARRQSKTENKTTSESTDPVAELEGKVTQIKDSLKAAVAQQRSLAAATRNR